MDTENPPTNKPSASAGNSLANRKPATKPQILAQIAALELHCPVFSPMTNEARTVWAEQLCADIAHKTLGEIMAGSRRYRTTPGNRWFPTSGDWLASMKSPWDEPKPRRYQASDNLLEPLPEGRAKELIEQTRKKYPVVFGCRRRDMDGPGE